MARVRQGQREVQITCFAKQTLFARQERIEEMGLKASQAWNGSKESMGLCYILNLICMIMVVIIHNKQLHKRY